MVTGQVDRPGITGSDVAGATPRAIRLCRGRYLARTADTARDISLIADLRLRCFGPFAAQGDDAFDARCLHVVVFDTQTDALVCSYRMLPLTGATLGTSYSARFYDLTALRQFAGPIAELGRFCIAPQTPDPDILRIAWGAMAAYVDLHGTALLMGCSSFAGTDTAPYLDAFATLKARHLAPARWRPKIAASEVFDYGTEVRHRPDGNRAMQAIPPLLRTYLAMGGWVSDHAVVDRQMNTLHVFTGVEIAAIPPARARLLRALAETRG